MLKQRQVGTSLDAGIRAGGAARAMAIVVPLAALAAAALIAAHDEGAADVVAGQAVAAAVEARDHGLGPVASLAVPRLALPMLSFPWETQPAPVAGSKPAAPARPVLKLTPEQQKVAQFVAKKYRIAVDDVQHLVAHAYRAAKEFRLDPYLVLAVMSIESSFNPNARSPAGAQGLMQVLTRVHVDKFAPFGGTAAAFDPVANISVGSRILKEYLVREGSVEGALKSYVGAALQDHDSGYGYKVLSERERIAAAAAGRVPVLPPKPAVEVREGLQEAVAQPAPSGSAAAEAGVAPVAPRAIPIGLPPPDAPPVPAASAAVDPHAVGGPGFTAL